MRRRALLSLLASPLSSAQRASGLQFVAEFKRGQALFDISEDGKLLAMYQFAGSSRCNRSTNCIDTTHKISAVNPADRRAARSTKIIFRSELIVPWKIAFIPDSQNMILRCERTAASGDTGLFEWNPVNDVWQRLVDPPPNFSFGTVFDNSRLLGTIPGNPTQRYVLWDFRTGEITDNLPEKLPSSETERRLAAAMLRTPGGPENAVRDLADLKDHRIYNAVISQRGELVVISGETGTNDNDGDPRRNPKFVSIYDARSRKNLRRQQLFLDEEVVERTTHFGRVTYTEGTLRHVASQMVMSPTNDLFAFSFERYDVGSPLLPGLDRSEPKFSVYHSDSLKAVGTVSHPKRNHWDDSGFFPDAWGSLLFSRDGKKLYTTTTSTREWRIA